MNASQALASCVRNYARGRGRAGRAEFLWWQLFFGVCLICSVSLTIATGNALYVIVPAVALALPTWAVTVRRMHDTDRRAWWLLLGVIPVGSLVLVRFQLQKGSVGENRFGWPVPGSRQAVGDAVWNASGASRTAPLGTGSRAYALAATTGASPRSVARGTGALTVAGFALWLFGVARVLVGLFLIFLLVRLYLPEQFADRIWSDLHTGADLLQRLTAWPERQLRRLA